MGAAYLAGLGVGLWTSADAVTAAWATDRVFDPSMDDASVDAVLATWKDAVGKA